MTLDAVVALLDGVLAADEIVIDEAERRALSSDVYAAGVTAALVIRPTRREALAQAVGLLTRQGYSIVPRGGGMSYTGGYTPDRAGCVVVDLSRLDRIIAVSAEDLTLTVECGMTWKRLYALLDPMGLRLPFFGTFSGAQATIGGGLSNGALFFGTARYGTATDNVLGIEVILADGTSLRTGQGGFTNVSKPFYRTYGPDLTGLFCHDCGALGIKVEATFRLIRKPEFTGFASFVFPGMEATGRAMSEVARTGATEELYVFDPESTRKNLQAGDLSQDLRTLANVVRAERSLLGGLARGAKMAVAGKDFVGADDFSLHAVCTGRSAAALDAELDCVRTACLQLGGREIPDSIPRAVRANLFPPPDGVLGPKGDRWAALNAKVAHSDGPRIIETARSAMAEFAEEFKQHGVWMSHLLIAVGQQAFSFEPVFHWFDAWLPMHERMPRPDLLASLQRPAENLAARAVVARARERMLQVFVELGAASNQIGRTYPYQDALLPPQQQMLRQLKSLVDPGGRMNPGVLGLGR